MKCFHKYLDIERKVCHVKTLSIVKPELVKSFRDFQNRSTYKYHNLAHHDIFMHLRCFEKVKYGSFNARWVLTELWGYNDLKDEGCLKIYDIVYERPPDTKPKCTVLIFSISTII